MFAAALFKIIKSRNNPNVYPLVNEEMKCGVSVLWNIVQT